MNEKTMDALMYKVASRMPENTLTGSFMIDDSLMKDYATELPLLGDVFSAIIARAERLKVEVLIEFKPRHTVLGQLFYADGPGDDGIKVSWGY